jgi:hypothetical protein
MLPEEQPTRPQFLESLTPGCVSPVQLEVHLVTGCIRWQRMEAGSEPETSLELCVESDS